MLEGIMLGVLIFALFPLGVMVGYFEGRRRGRKVGHDEAERGRVGEINHDPYPWWQNRKDAHEQTRLF